LEEAEDQWQPVTLVDKDQAHLEEETNRWTSVPLKDQDNTLKKPKDAAMMKAFTHKAPSKECYKRKKEETHHPL